MSNPYSKESRNTCVQLQCWSLGKLSASKGELESVDTVMSY